MVLGSNVCSLKCCGPELIRLGMALNEIEFAILIWVFTDYESVETIRDNATAEIGLDISEQEISESLLSLFAKGLV